MKNKTKTYPVQIQVPEALWNRIQKKAFEVRNKFKKSRKLYLGEVIEAGLDKTDKKDD